MKIICFLKGHLPFWEPDEEFVEEGSGRHVQIGGYRWCGRCGVVLEGTALQVGDMRQL